MRRLLALSIVVAFALVACADDEGPASPIDGHPATLAGTSWIVTAIGGIAPGRGNAPTIAFAEAEAQGSGGCNRFGGRYRYEPTTGELRFDEMGMTAMACAKPERDAVESAFLRALGQPALVAHLEPGGHLVLAGATGRLDLDPVGPAVTD